MSDCVTGRRQTDCINIKAVDDLNRDVAKLGGQLTLFKWLLGILITVIILLSGGLYARTDDIKEETNAMQKELIREINSLNLKLEKNNSQYAILHSKLESISEDVKDVAAIASFNQKLIKEKR